MNSSPEPSAATSAEPLVRQAVEAYFAALHNADTDGLAAVFHPTATLMGWDEGELRRVSLEQWFRFVNSTPSPASEGVTCDGEILAVDISETAAMVKVSESYRAFRYVDYMSLIQTADGWRIVGKCYHQYSENP
ncbi:MAG: hypothetical protein DRR42_02565 [Gammaproteobacteria bacterium]|nr:MAG: hypothetical protein DRR42_02565 [Gammaproteobacteria bacterium]